MGVTFATGNSGVFSETVVATGNGYNAGGYVGAPTAEILVVTGTVQALAAAQITPLGTLDFGKAHVGATFIQAVTVANTAVGLAQALDASVAASGSASASSSISLWQAGSVNTSSIQVGLTGTATDGVRSGDVVFGLTSVAGGGAPTLLAPQTLAVTGTLYALASGSVAQSGPGIVHVHDLGVTTLSVTNTGANDGCTESLIATAGAVSGGLTGAAGTVELVTVPGSDITGSSTSLAFAATIDPNPKGSKTTGGPFNLDDIVLTANTAAAPEPPAGWLLAIGAVALAAVVRRRRGHASAD